MSKVLENLKYSKSHEWVRLEGSKAYVGLTDYAQESLGAIVYVDLSDVDEEVSQFAPFGAVESIKAASDINSPISGKIIEINEDVVDNPELLNKDPYVNYLVVVEVSDPEEMDNLMDSASYLEEIK